MKKKVIYSRFSSEMQRADSCDDQERNVRRDLPRFGVSGAGALVIRDEAESGTRSSRDGFQQLLGMIARGEVAVLAVDDQSRLSRADNAYSLIQDLVFAGGRFISTGEGIDTDQKGWELRVKVMELHNSTTVRELGHRVRRGQEGRVLSDGSAGDFPFGYESYYLDADWAEQLKRRGPKPKKGLRVCEPQAGWVRQAFAWFLEGRSIGWIARELSRQAVPKEHRASRPGWHHQQVRRLLANEKYAGRWAWGATTTRRNSQGQKKQVAVPAEQQVVRDRPELRIVDPATWDRAQKRLAELSARYGPKEGQKRRGQKAHPGAVYPRSLLGGLLVCGRCGARLWHHQSGRRRYYACPGHAKGLCDLAAQVPADRAEEGLARLLTGLLSGWPDWLQAVYRRLRELVQQAAAEVPERCRRDGKRLAEVKRQMENLVDALADGRLTCGAVKDRLAKLEEEARALQQRLEAQQALLGRAVELPEEAWLAEQLRRWVGPLAEDGPRAAAVLRQAVGRVTAEAVVAPGKRRGYTRLHFRVRGWDVLAAALGGRLPEGVRTALTPGPDCKGTAPEFELDLGAPTPMDRWAAQIAAWRQEGVTWAEIVRRTGLDLNRAYRAWKRYTAAQGGGTGRA
jgi:DNA invertase Pin-like site-specific DNA recombinase